LVDVSHRHCSHIGICLGVLEGTEMTTVIEMAREAGAIRIHERPKEFAVVGNEAIERFAEIVRADERKQCAEKTGEFAKKWWKIHCDSNLHYSSTLKAHQDFCALQAAIRKMSNT